VSLAILEDPRNILLLFLLPFSKWCVDSVGTIFLCDASLFSTSFCRMESLSFWENMLRFAYSLLLVFLLAFQKNLVLWH
jgi:hypothetical protein